jgi:ribonuclease P protein component
VAFAIGRAAGSAPTRNRVRRRLRALAREHARELAPGWYLIGADAAFARTTPAEAEAQLLGALRDAGALAVPGDQG